MLAATISDPDFDRLRRFFHGASGIRLADGKKALVCGRLGRRVQALGLAGWGAYLDHLERPAAAAERQAAVDLLTIHETHFFREPRHFELLRDELWRLACRPVAQPVRLWSAACATGEEAYSLAMTTAEVLGPRPWRVLGTDIAASSLEHARRGVYDARRAAEVPATLAARYLHTAEGAAAGSRRIDRVLQERVDFAPANLAQPLPAMAPFDVIFLRNVLIYFDAPARRQIVARVAQALRPGGLLVLGHCEPVDRDLPGLEPVMPTAYRRSTAAASGR